MSKIYFYELVQNHLPLFLIVFNELQFSIDA
jgi:hypothetical protein